MYLTRNLWVAALTLTVPGIAIGQDATPPVPSEGAYRLPFADRTEVKIFDDYLSHRPVGRTDLYALGGKTPYRIVAAAGGRIAAIQDGFSEQQSGRAAKDCHNNYVWIMHPNGEWTDYSHLRAGSVTHDAHLKVGDRVKAGQFVGYEGAVGCAMLEHVHFEVAVPASAQAIDEGGFLLDNDGGKREREPRFCGVPDERVKKGEVYAAHRCGRG